MDFASELSLYIDGEAFDVGDGVTLRVCSTSSPAYLEAADRLERELRAELGLEPERPLPAWVTIRVFRDAMVGTVLMGWSGVKVKGKAVKFSEAAALRLLKLPAFTAKLEAALALADKKAGLEEKETRRAAKKSKPASAGS